MTLLMTLVMMTLAAAQQPTHLVFEVAAVRQNHSVDADSSLRRPVGGRFTAQNVTLEELILFAYEKQRFEVLDAPSWIRRDRFDVSATMGEPPRGSEWSAEDTRRALQALLEDRFGLLAREEKRERPTYALIRTSPSAWKPGPSLRSSPDECRDACGIRQVPGIIQLSGRPLSLFAAHLGRLVGRVVTDETGLTGNWDFELKTSPDGEPSLFTALQEQLGLKLEAGQRQVPVLVIERVEHPKEN